MSEIWPSQSFVKCEDEPLEGLVENKSNDKMEWRIFKQKMLIIGQSGLLAPKWEETKKRKEIQFLPPPSHPNCD